MTLFWRSDASASDIDLVDRDSPVIISWAFLVCLLPKATDVELPAYLPFPPCRRGEVAITVPPLMGFSLGRTMALTVCATVFLVCSCDRHESGEYPEVQREKGAEPSPATAQVETSTSTPPPSSATPAAKPTPVDFFPTKPR